MCCGNKSIIIITCSHEDFSLTADALNVEGSTTAISHERLCIIVIFTTNHNWLFCKNCLQLQNVVWWTQCAVTGACIACISFFFFWLWMCPNTQDIKGTYTLHDWYPSSECTGTVALGPYSIILLHKTISSVQEAILIWLALILSQSFQHFWSLKLNIRFLSKTTHLRYDELTMNIFFFTAFINKG